MGIQNFDDFYKELKQAGFSAGMGNAEGIYSVIPFGWNELPPYETEVRWHTGVAKTDPWEWRMRVLDEKDDVAYAKIFFKKSGFITKEWYPYFLAARREGMDLEAEYREGRISAYARQIYDLFTVTDRLPVDEMKRLMGSGKDDKARFDRALVELQMKLYLTMSGRRSRVTNDGQEYGWASTVFTTTEHFWGEEVFTAAAAIGKEEAAAAITEQVYRLNPDAEAKRIVKFIG
ncbi:MAG: hypothetical protein LBV33_08360 [Lachnospiraceae bacterium]|jgi:hypothetical protein|nr:hypothetical protein [Lachnospiraceae bacterium]